MVFHYDMNKSYKRDMLLDLSGYENHGQLVLGKGRVTKDNIDKIPNTIVPDRRYGTMECMYHEDEGIVDQKFAGDPEATARNEVIYRKKMQKDKIGIDEDEYGCGPPDVSNSKWVIYFDPLDMAPTSGLREALFLPG